MDPFEADPRFVDDDPPPDEPKAKGNGKDHESKPNGHAPAEDRWSEPLDLFTQHLPGTATVDKDCLPEPLLSFALSEGARIGVDPVGIAGLALGVCSGVASDLWRIRIKFRDTWAQNPRLWIGLVAPPGSRKTEQVNAAKRPVDLIEKELRLEYKKKLAAYSEELEAWEKEDKKKRGKKPKPPAEVNITIQDATIEAISELLKADEEGEDEPKKLLMVTDELTMLFGSFDRYSAGKVSAARSDWLRLYEGGPNKINRIIRGSVFCPNYSVAVVGGIQPEKLGEMAKDLATDGMLQRVTPIYPDLTIKHDIEDDDHPSNPIVTAKYEDLIRRLRTMRPPPKDGGGYLEVRANERGQEERRRLFRLIDRIASDPTLPAALKEAVTKWSGLLARIALVFHLIRHANREVDDAVTLDPSTIRMAVNYIMRVVAPSTFKLFREVGIEGNANARWIAGHILAKRLDKFTARDIGRAFGELRGDDVAIMRAMSLIEHAGWVTADFHPRKPTWTVVPRVHELFAERAKAEREWRERTQQLIRKPLTEYVT